MSTIPKSIFTEAFVRLNRLDQLGFQRWIFLPGMEFQTQHKWWQAAGSRPTAHEGLDICCFEGSGAQVVYLSENTLVPVMYDGTVVKILTDFLGESILVAHDFMDKERNLYSIYAHTEPHKNLQAGSRVKSGKPIAEICPSKNKSMNPHLHLTLLWAPEIVIGGLDWQTINHADQVILCNPLFFL